MFHDYFQWTQTIQRVKDLQTSWTIIEVEPSDFAFILYILAIQVNIIPTFGWFAPTWIKDYMIIQLWSSTWMQLFSYIHFNKLIVTNQIVLQPSVELLWDNPLPQQTSWIKMKRWAPIKGKILIQKVNDLWVHKSNIGVNL
jgi:hypothetical protein